MLKQFLIWRVKNISQKQFINHEPDCWGRLGSNSRLIKNTAHNLGGILKTLVLKHLILITAFILTYLRYYKYCNVEQSHSKKT